jgi:hypothetical protein
VLLRGIVILGGVALLDLNMEAVIIRTADAAALTLGFGVGALFGGVFPAAGGAVLARSACRNSPRPVATLQQR